MASSLKSVDDRTATIQPLPVESEAKGALVSLYYKHMAVTFQGGQQLTGPDGNPLRASRIKVWTDDFQWMYGPNGDQVIRTPLGNGVGAETDWAFPSFVQFSVVLFQPQDGIMFAIKAASSANAQEVLLNNNKNILFNVNDKLGTYGDNSGAYSLNIEVLQS